MTSSYNELYTTPGSIFCFKTSNGVSVFQIVSLDKAELDDGSYYIDRLLIKSLNTSEKILDVNVDSMSEAFGKQSCPHSFLTFTTDDEFNSKFQFIGHDIEFEFNPKQAPQWTIWPRWYRSWTDFIPPEWHVCNIEYAEGFFKCSQESVSVLKRSALPNKFKNCLSHWTHDYDSYIRGVKKPYYQDTGILSLNHLICRWTPKRIALWEELFEKRYQITTREFDIYKIEEECQDELFSDEPKQSHKSNPLIFKVESINGVPVHFRSTLKEVRSQFNRFVNQVIDHFDTNKEKKAVKAQLTDVVQQLLNSVTKCKSNVNNCEIAIAAAVNAFNELNDSYDGTLIETEERESLYESLCSVGDYVECDVADIIEDNRDW